MAKIRFSGPEKRTYMRVSARCAIKYAKLSKKLKPLMDMITKAHTKNISAGGLKFVVREKVPLNTILEFEFEIPGTSKQLVGLGEVTRIRKNPGKRVYDVGLKFLWVQQEKAKLIDAYVRKKRVSEILEKIHRK